jgi:hypothetical protein
MSEKEINNRSMDGPGSVEGNIMSEEEINIMSEEEVGEEEVDQSSITVQETWIENEEEVRDPLPPSDEQEDDGDIQDSIPNLKDMHDSIPISSPHESSQFDIVSAFVNNVKMTDEERRDEGVVSVQPGDEDTEEKEDQMEKPGSLKLDVKHIGQENKRNLSINKSQSVYLPPLQRKNSAIVLSRSGSAGQVGGIISRQLSGIPGYRGRHEEGLIDRNLVESDDEDDELVVITDEEHAVQALTLDMNVEDVIIDQNQPSVIKKIRLAKDCGFPGEPLCMFIIYSY